MSMYIKHTNFCSTVIQRTLKYIWFTATVFNNHENKLTYPLLCFHFLVKTPSEILRQVAAHCEKQSFELFTLSFHHLTSSPVRSASLPVFKPPPWVISELLMNSPMMLWGYTPSSMPMKSEPFCIVMEAPAALSTNMEVYWPACRGTQVGVDAERSHTHTHTLLSLRGHSLT